MRYRAIACLLAATLLVGCEQKKAAEPAAPAAAPGTAPAAPAAQSPGQQLNTIVEAYYDKYLELNPLQATFIDDHRFDDRLANDIGPEVIAKSLALEKQYLDEVQKIDPKTLSDQDRLTYEIFLRDRRTAIEGFDFPGELIPINQFFSLPNFFAQLGSGSSVQPFATYEDYQHFLGRARDFAVWMDQAITNMKLGVERGVVQPRVVIEKAIPQLEAQITDDWTKSLFHRPIESMPDSLSAEQRTELTTAYEQTVTGTIIPAYKRLRDYLRDDYLSTPAIPSVPVRS
jgi:uncharacterized protein (DUF885 family)